MYRISEQLQARIIAAIQALEVTDEERELIGWDINPILLSRAPGTMPQFSFVVAISVPIPGTEDDRILHMEPLPEAHAAQDVVSALVLKLHASATAEAREERVRITVTANGEKRTEGGLLLPE